MPQRIPQSILTISMESSAPVLHDAILLCIGIAAVYLVVAALQLFQLKRIGVKSARHDREPSLSQVPADDATRPEEDVFAARFQPSQIEAMFKRLGSEMERLGTEVQAWRDELRRRDANLSPLSESSHPKMPAAATHYNEAMAFARAGMSAAGIALKCNVSLGEAELVTALVRGTGQVTAQGHEQTNSRLYTQPHDGYRAAA